MTAPTHAGFAILIAAMCDAGLGATTAAALGGLIPDIDHPQSSIGRVFFFLSIPIRDRFGHRGLIHSVFLYAVPLIVGILMDMKILQWLMIGAISHGILDCLNKSGVRLFLPFSDLTVVCFNKDWRIRTASVPEVIVFSLIVSVIYLTNYTYTIGGPRKLINILINSPRITQEEYVRAGQEICYAKGDFRWHYGTIEKGVKWLVVGTEDNGNTLVYWDGYKIIKTRHGEFIRSELIQTKKEWNFVTMRGFAIPRQNAFYFDGAKWHHAKGNEDLAFGWIKSVDGRLELSPAQSNPQIAPTQRKASDL